MKLRDTIKKILKEELKGKFDYTQIIQKLLNDLLVKENPDIICGVEVFNPQNRRQKQFGEHQYYRVDIIFIGGYGSKYFPRTMAVNERYDNLANRAQDIILDFVGLFVEVYAKYVTECE